MATKKEYEDAIKKIREAFYSSICDEWALEQIAVNLDFLSSLINEHFEEKQETNYEHYEDEIIELYIEDLAISNGKMRRCCAIPCSECGFVNENGDCSGHRRIKEWLKQSYKKPTYKLTQFEYDLIQTYLDCHKNCKFRDCDQLRRLKNEGYFKCVNHDVKVQDVLKNCEIK